MILRALGAAAEVAFSASDAAKDLVPAWVPVLESVAKGEEPSTDDLMDLIFENAAPKVKVGDHEFTVDPTGLGTAGKATYDEMKKNANDYIERTPEETQKAGADQHEYEIDGKKYKTRDTYQIDGKPHVYNPETNEYEPVDE